MLKPKLIILAGGNGSGKSTFYSKYLASYKDAKYLNADNYLKNKKLEQTPENTKKAQSNIREACENMIESRQSFVFETVFSHNSKLGLIQKAKQNNFHVILIYLYLKSDDLNVARVSQRVREGGHDVPEEKIRTRIPRTIDLMYEAIKVVDEMIMS